MFLYTKLLRGECCGCVVKLHRRLAEGWLKPGWWPVEQHCYKDLCIKWKKVVPSTVLPSPCLKQNCLYILRYFLEEVGDVYFTSVAPHKTSCAGEDLARGILDCQCQLSSLWDLKAMLTL